MALGPALIVHGKQDGFHVVTSSANLTWFRLFSTWLRKYHSSKRGNDHCMYWVIPILKERNKANFKSNGVHWKRILHLFFLLPNYQSKISFVTKGSGWTVGLIWSRVDKGNLERTSWGTGSTRKRFICLRAQLSKQWLLQLMFRSYKV